MAWKAERHGSAIHDHPVRTTRSEPYRAGDRPFALNKLTPLALQNLYSGKLAKGLSVHTVFGMHRMLHRSLGQAVKWQLIPYSPSDAVKPPRPGNAPMQVWDREQVRTFLAGIAGHPLEALWTLAVFIGMRKGELLALHWDDIDLQGRNLTVRYTLTKEHEGWGIGEPKSAAGRRRIGLTTAVVSALRSHRAAQVARRLQLGPAWQDTGLVFDRGDGHYIEPVTINNELDRIIKPLELPYIRFHDLRHTAATLMLTNGTPAKVVSEMLGHANVGIMLNTYAHVLPHMQQEALDRLEAALLG